MIYTRDDIINALRESGVNAGDSVFFTTSLGMIGMPPSEIDSSDKLNEFFLDAIIEVIGDGNIIIPTYSYTFGKGSYSNPAVFDVEMTPSTIGPFPNYILSRPDFIRSKDPFVSVACRGPDCKRFFSGLSNSSYGEDSFFSKMVKISNMKCCSIGLGPNWTPFIHYSDWLSRVPFRYDKIFDGYIRDHEGEHYVSWTYSVPCQIPEARSSAHKVGRLAEKAGIWSSAKLARARIYTSHCSRYFDFVMEQLKYDKWSLATGPKVDVVEKERERINDIIDAPVPASYKVKKYKTGDYVGDWLVPERWVCHKARLISPNGEVLSQKPFDYSVSIKQVIGASELRKHVSSTMKNLYKRRDWGFVYNAELDDGDYLIEIDSSFGLGEISIAEKDNMRYAVLNNRLVELV